MIVQSFWSGEFGPMEQMSVESHARQGHDFHLYTYEPQRIVERFRHPKLFIAPADQIVPKERLATFPSPSLFSDYFRYALLVRNGGWWVDLDTIALKPFDGIDPTQPYVFASDNIDHFYVSGCVMRAPAENALMSTAKAWINAKDPTELRILGHMDIGPNLLQRYVPKFGLTGYVAPPLWFDPVPWDKITGIVDPQRTFDLSQSYVLHLRKSIWDEGPNASAGVLPDGSKLSTIKTYPEGCLWEQLKRSLLQPSTSTPPSPSPPAL